MKKMSLLILCLITANVSYAQQTEEYVFRNDVRPEYSKNITVDELSTLQKNEDITLIDVRLTEDFALDPTLIPGAKYNDPELINTWADLIPKDKKSNSILRQRRLGKPQSRDLPQQ